MLPLLLSAAHSRSSRVILTCCRALGFKRSRQSCSSEWIAYPEMISEVKITSGRRVILDSMHF